MSGNAHANRQRRRPSVSHKSNCLFCQYRSKEAKTKHLYKNTNGHRHNPTHKRGSRRNPTKHVNQ